MSMLIRKIDNLVTCRAMVQRKNVSIILIKIHEARFHVMIKNSNLICYLQNEFKNFY